MFWHPARHYGIDPVTRAFTSDLKFAEGMYLSDSHGGSYRLAFTGNYIKGIGAPKTGDFIRILTLRSEVINRLHAVGGPEHRIL